MNGKEALCGAAPSSSASPTGALWGAAVGLLGCSRSPWGVSEPSMPLQAPCQAGSEDEALEEELMDGDGSRPWTPQEKALHEARLKAKAKRRLRRTSSRDSTREPAA